MGLEQHEGEEMTEFLFWVNIIFMVKFQVH